MGKSLDEQIAEAIEQKLEPFREEVKSLHAQLADKEAQINALIRKPKGTADAPPIIQSSPDPVTLINMVQDAQDRGEEKTLRVIKEVTGLVKEIQGAFVQGIETGNRIRKEAIEDHTEFVEGIQEELDDALADVQTTGAAPLEPEDQIMLDTAGRLLDKYLPPGGNGGAGNAQVVRGPGSSGENQS